MNPIIKCSFYLLVAALTLSGCNNQNNDRDLFNYKGSYIGDASAVGDILNRLPVTGYSKDFELQTDEAPYGITLNYNGLESAAERQEIIIYTASYLFTLIQNVDYIQYNFPDHPYHITKHDWKKEYVESGREAKNDNDLNKIIEQHLNRQKVK